MRNLFQRKLRLHQVSISIDIYMKILTLTRKNKESFQCNSIQSVVQPFKNYKQCFFLSRNSFIYLKMFVCFFSWSFVDGCGGGGHCRHHIASTLSSFVLFFFISSNYGTHLTHSMKHIRPIRHLHWKIRTK